MEAFKVEVQNNMEKELKAAVDNRVKTQVMDGLVEVTSLDVPKALINDECERMRQDMMRQFGGGQQIDPNMLPLELFSDQADRRVRLGLIVNAIVEQENVVTDEDAVRAKIEEIASSYEEPEQLINYYYSNEQQLNQVQSLVLEEQIVALVLASAQVIDEPVSYDEAIKPPAPESSDEDDANQTSDADADLAPEPDQSAETDDEAPAPELSPEAVNKAETKD
jgi:trigger factor